MRDWKCYVTTTDRNLSWDDRDVTGVSRWAWLVSSIPGSDSDPGALCKWYQQSSHSCWPPSDPSMQIGSRVIGIGIQGEEEWGRFKVLWCLGLAARLSGLMFDLWLASECLEPSPEHDTIIPIVIFPPPSLSLLLTSPDPSSAPVLTCNPN